MAGIPDSVTGKPDEDRDSWGWQDGQGPAGSLLSRTLAAGQLAVTAEIGPPRGASTAPVTRKAVQLAGWVHAVNVTDNQSANARLAGWAGCLAAMNAGVEPIMQLTCRDRNRIALQSELLAASAVGIRNVLVMTGDHPRHGDHADATPVFDLDSTELLAAARAMRDEGRLLSGRELMPPPCWLLGAVTDLAPADAAVTRLAAKVAAGAQFAQTQYVFDVPAFAGWLRRAGEAGLLERCHVLAGVGPVLSERALAHLAGVPGIVIPDAVAARLAGAGGRAAGGRAAGGGGGSAGGGGGGGGGGSAERFRAAGEELCAETIAALRELPGLSGIHVMAPGAEAVIPGILRAAGLSPVADTARAGA